MSFTDGQMDGRHLHRVQRYYAHNVMDLVRTSQYEVLICEPVWVSTHVCAATVKEDRSGCPAVCPYRLLLKIFFAQRQ
jgi:hypothetical protein